MTPKMRPTRTRSARSSTAFTSAAPEVACLQGVLDFYNPRTNWLARCFTIEYATWFRADPARPRAAWACRCRWAAPRCSSAATALEELGGWDAHNVTEDADLGMRLARHGYRTELIDTVTGEEANCRAAALGQATLALDQGLHDDLGRPHARPARCCGASLGRAAFVGLSGAVPGHHPAGPAGAAAVVASGSCPSACTTRSSTRCHRRAFLGHARGSSCLSEAVEPDHRHRRPAPHPATGLSPLWVLTLNLYYPLASLAAYKALWELLTQPVLLGQDHATAFRPGRSGRPSAQALSAAQLARIDPQPRLEGLARYAVFSA